MNEQIDNQISQLKTRASYDINARAQINTLQQQRNFNNYQMQQPMSQQEYDEYDDYGQYIGNQTSPTKPLYEKQNNSLGQIITDGVAHMAQGVSLGWSDELIGAIGGVGQVMGNALYRATGHSTKGEILADAWRNGYEGYRDFSRQELQNIYKRNPAVSGLAEVGGALASPVKFFKGMRGAVANGVIGGVGMTDTNTPTEYAVNIGLNTAGSVAGEKFGSILGKRLQNLQFGLSNLNKPVRAFTKASTNSLTNQLNNWRKNEE